VSPIGSQTAVRRVPDLSVGVAGANDDVNQRARKPNPLLCQAVIGIGSGNLGSEVLGTLEDPRSDRLAMRTAIYLKMVFFLGGEKGRSRLGPADTSWRAGARHAEARSRSNILGSGSEAEATDPRALEAGAMMLGRAGREH